jgi:hypothetical protein
LKREGKIQVRSDLDFIVKFFIVQFYTFEHNSKSNRWIEQKLDLEISEVLFYVGVRFKVNQSLEGLAIGQNSLYEFCYLLPFDLWTFYLARILFLQECGSLFWDFSISTRIFNELQYNLQVWKDSLMFQNPFFIRIPYSS